MYIKDWPTASSNKATTPLPYTPHLPEVEALPRRGIDAHKLRAQQQVGGRGLHRRVQVGHKGRVAGRVGLHRHGRGGADELGGHHGACTHTHDKQTNTAMVMHTGGGWG